MKPLGLGEHGEVTFGVEHGPSQFIDLRPRFLWPAPALEAFRCVTD